jgi:hypothetical protein
MFLHIMVEHNSNNIIFVILFFSMYIIVDSNIFVQKSIHNYVLKNKNYVLQNQLIEF